MRICITTFYTKSYYPLAQITVKTMDLYCKKHGYHLDVKVIDDDESFHFVKTQRTRHLLNDFDVVAAIECDCLITNLTIPITNFIDSENELFYTTDRNGANFGVYIVKSSKWTKELFDWINMQKDKYGDEQNVIENNLNIDKAKIVRHPCFNSIPYDPYYAPSFGKIHYVDGEMVAIPTENQGHWVVGNFICHLPGISDMNKRVEIFNEIKEHIIYE